MLKRSLLLLLVLGNLVPAFAQGAGAPFFYDFLNDSSPRIRAMLDGFFVPLSSRPGMTDGRLELTLASIDSDLKKSPKNLRPWVEKAFVLGLQGQLQEAADAIGEAEKINPNDPIIYFTIASLYLADADPMRLRMNLMKAIALNAVPPSFSARVYGENFASWFRNQKQYGFDEHRYGFTDQFLDFRKGTFVGSPFFESPGLPRFLFADYKIIDDQYSVNWISQIPVEGKSLVAYRLYGILPWGTDQMHFIYQVFYK